MRSPFVMECGVYRTSYAQDHAFNPTWVANLRVALILAALAAFPLAAPPYWVSLANLAGIAAISALGLNLLTGFTGQISIGHGAFMGVGAYTAAVLVTRAGLDFWLALPLAGLAAALVGSLFGLPSLRLKGLYLAMATLAAQVIINYTIVHWRSLTNGSQGIILSRPSLFGQAVQSETAYYYVVLALAAVVYTFAFNLSRSRVGRAFKAVRDRDLAAEVMGIDLFRYKILSFATSSFLAGIAGALFAFYVNIATPEHYSTFVSVQYLAMIIVGGLGNVMGSIYGAVFITLLPVGARELVDLLRLVFPNAEAWFQGLQQFFFGLVIILFLILEPEGIARIWGRVKDYFHLWPFSY